MYAKSDECKGHGIPTNFKSIRMRYKAFVKKEKGKICAKDFLYVVQNPLFDLEDVKQVIEFIPQMKLHLPLGIVNHLYKSMLKLWPKGNEWPLLLKMKLQSYHAGEFVRDDCDKLLKNMINQTLSPIRNLSFLSFFAGRLFFSIL